MLAGAAGRRDATLGHIRVARNFMGPAVGAGAMALAVVLVHDSLVARLLTFARVGTKNA